MKNVIPPLSRKATVSTAEFIHCGDCKVKDCSVLRNCSAECLDVISVSKKMCRFVAGQRILMEGNQARGIYFVEEGKVKIYKSDNKGQEIILRFAREGDIIGYNTVEENSEYHVSAIAITDTVTCFLDADTFKDLTRKYPEFAYELLQFYKLQLQLTERKAFKMATMTVPEKVADALLAMYDAYGANGDGMTLNLTLSRQEIASLAGTTKEQVSKAISDLKVQGIIEAKGKAISLVDIRKLQQIAKV